jgi:aspartate aminotransferase
LSYDLDEIIVRNGSLQALLNALLATLAPGDEVIVPSPYYAPYLEQVRLSEASPVLLQCARNEGFKLRPVDLRAAPRTRWIILNNPVNPSGAAYTTADLSALAEVLLEHPNICPSLKP